MSALDEYFCGFAFYALSHSGFALVVGRHSRGDRKTCNAGWIPRFGLVGTPLASRFRRVHRHPDSLRRVKNWTVMPRSSGSHCSRGKKGRPRQRAQRAPVANPSTYIVLDAATGKNKRLPFLAIHRSSFLYPIFTIQDQHLTGIVQ